MKLFDYLKMVYPDLTPEKTKIHLAQTNEYKEDTLVNFGSGHGGNVGIGETFSNGEPDRLQNITFAILELMDPNAGEGEIDRRGTHWKQILLSREFGRNRN